MYIMEVATIVISSIALASSILSPLIVAGAMFINRIKKSSCCFGTSGIELMDKPSSPNNQPLQQPTNPHIDIRKSTESLKNI